MRRAIILATLAAVTACSPIEQDHAGPGQDHSVYVVSNEPEYGKSVAMRQRHVEEVAMTKADQRCAAEGGKTNVLQKTWSSFNTLMMTYNCR